MIPACKLGELWVAQIFWADLAWPSFALNLLHLFILSFTPVCLGLWGMSCFSPWNFSEISHYCGCLLPGDFQGQVGWGRGQPGLLLDVEAGRPACSRWVWVSRSLRSFAPQATLRFCDIQATFFLGAILLCCHHAALKWPVAIGWQYHFHC